VRISLFYELSLPRPWTEDSEKQLFDAALEEIEAADKAGFSTVWMTEHHFMEEYCHATAPEVFFGAASQRTSNIRLGHGIMHMPPVINHPARVAERVSTLDLLSGGRVEFGTGEAASQAELGGFNVDPADKRAMWEEAVKVATRCMTETPFTGFEGRHVSMPPRNVIPKPLQRPHPPVWVACSRHATTIMAAERGIGALSLSFDGPEPLKPRVEEYYRVFEEDAVPLTAVINPNISAIAGDLPMMVAPTEDQAIERLGISGGFLAHGIVHYYGLGGHRPGRKNLWEEYLAKVELDPRMAYGPKRGAIGSPEQVREWLLDYEASGVDEVMLLTNPHSHEATMESIELMAKYVLPEFLERDEKVAVAKAARMAPVIEKVEARRVNDAPGLDPAYSFGRLPTGEDGRSSEAETALAAVA